MYMKYQLHNIHGLYAAVILSSFVVCVYHVVV